ncbi:ankyrin, partial [Fistulina hepatica ATCC 64428]
DERLLAAARIDNEELITEVFESGDFDINFRDGCVRYALHLAVSHGATDVLEHILAQEGCDVDIQNRLEKATPFHLAIRLEDEEIRDYVVESLLDAGADPNIKDKNGETVMDLVSGMPDVKALIRKAQAQAQLDREEVVNDDDDDEGGSGSASDDD